MMEHLQDGEHRNYRDLTVNHLDASQIIQAFPRIVSAAGARSKGKLYDRFPRNSKGILVDAGEDAGALAIYEVFKGSGERIPELLIRYVRVSDSGRKDARILLKVLETIAAIAKGESVNQISMNAQNEQLFKIVDEFRRRTPCLGERRSSIKNATHVFTLDEIETLLRKFKTLFGCK